MPRDKKTKIVQIYCRNCSNKWRSSGGGFIRGFKFFDQNQTLIFKIGHVMYGTVTEVVLEDKEQIVGLVYKPPNFIYTTGYPVFNQYIKDKTTFP